MNGLSRYWLPVLVLGFGIFVIGGAQADTGKLRLTGGVNSIDGVAGGGLTPWAIIGTNASAGERGVSAFATRVKPKDYALDVLGVVAGFNDRIEFSLARQEFDTKATGAALGLPGLKLEQNIIGVKVKVAGEAILDSDTWMPQIAVGLIYKDLDAGGLAPTLDALGAKQHGTDFYVSATKLLLAQSVLLNGTLRATKANQNGLLGFGGTAQNDYRVMPEFSVAYLLRKDLAIGAEYRVKPDNLNPSILGAGLKEDDWKDLFIAWAPTKNVALTAAYVDLGRIVPAIQSRKQTGWYLSAQVSF
ncbi:MAG: DUF3034 family protein [Burkholderiales bacterium]|nr:DUF3034 family protein [Burkholderiales bacterium]